MARISEDDEADIPLGGDQWEGAVDVSVPRLTTPEEDVIIASMRDRVRGAPA
jgi:hypothetical protein